MCVPVSKCSPKLLLQICAHFFLLCCTKVKAMVGCSAPNCHNRSEKGVRHFAFPAEQDRRKRWLINCRRDKWVPTSTSRLCEEHFDASQFESKRMDGWRKLKSSAVPTIFSVPNPPPVLQSRRRVLKRCFVDDDNDNTSMKTQRIAKEHSYAKSFIKEGNSDSASVPSTQLPSVNIAAESRDSSSLIKNNNEIVPHEATAYEIAESSFLDLGIAAEVEMVTSQPSPRKQVFLENLVQDQMQKIRQLSGEVRRLKRQLKASQRDIRNLKAKFKNIFSPDQIRVLQTSNGTNRGRKWSAQTVQRSLQVLFACGPSGYKLLLSQGYPLPATRTLRKSLEGIRFDSGLLKEVFELLRLKVAEMHDKEKDCALTLDEMSISPSAEYDTRTGRLMGEVTLPGHSGRATHAMVFMLSGISTRWKQTVAYYFTGNSVYGSALKPIVVNIITKAWEIGLRVRTVTCDMGACNRTMWSTFGICCGRMMKTINQIPHPCSSQYELYFLADSPHLIKNLKAALVNGQDITLPDWIVKEQNLGSNTVTANHLRALMAFQSSMQLKISPGLTTKTLAPNHFDKMKVSNAMSFFSHSNAAGLEYLVKAHSHNTDFLTTAWFLKTMNKWFDLVSSRRRVTALSLKDPVQYRKAMDFLRSIIHLFETLSIGNKGAWKPVQTGIILTTQSIINVTENLLASGYQFILTSRLTSDCIENLFSFVRTNNAVPSPLEFKNKLRLLSARSEEHTSEL